MTQLRKRSQHLFMAAKIKKGRGPGRPFKKGGDPRQAQQIDPALSVKRPSSEYITLKQFGLVEMNSVLIETLYMTNEELISRIKDPKERGLVSALASVIRNARIAGDMSRINDFFDRINGKVGQKITIANEGELEQFKNLPIDERRKKLEELRSINDYKLKREEEFEQIARGEKPIE